MLRVILLCSAWRWTTGDIWVRGDGNLKAENIKKGVNIFGVTGTADQFSGTVKWIIQNGQPQIPVTYGCYTSKNTSANIPGQHMKNPWIEGSTMVFYSWAYLNKQHNTNDAYGYIDFTLPIQANKTVTMVAYVTNASWFSSVGEGALPWESAGISLRSRANGTGNIYISCYQSLVSRVSGNAFQNSYTFPYTARKAATKQATVNELFQMRFSGDGGRTYTLGQCGTTFWVQNLWVEFS